MNYIEYQFIVSPKEIGAEILVAELGEVGFESFIDTENGVNAYIQEELWDKNILDNVFILSNPDFNISFSFEKIEQINWNEEWEKNFNPIVVDDICTVRATFHPTPNTLYDIIIDPKMSFGTGHHETTFMMLQYLISKGLKNKKILDMGCGTGILAIMAAMRGATEIDAIDIDPWCVENAQENICRNQFLFISIKEGNATSIENKKYNVIIANINRNILLEDIPLYINHLEEEGILLLSGFYKEDIPVINQKCVEHNLIFIDNKENNHWVACQYKLTKK